MPQIGGVKTPAKLRSQCLPQLRQQTLPVSRPLRPALLELHNVPPYMPVSLHLDGVYSPQHLLARVSNQLAQVAQQRRKAFGRIGSSGFVDSRQPFLCFDRHGDVPLLSRSTEDLSVVALRAATIGFARRFSADVLMPELSSIT